MITSHRDPQGEKRRPAARCLLLLLSIPLMLCFVISYGSAADDSIVRNIEIKGLHVISRDELLYLLDIFPGKPLNEKIVREGIKRAFLKGVFEDIAVETIDGGEPAVIVHVREKLLIKRIAVRGSYALSKKTILSLFPLREDQYLTCGALESGLSTLKRELALRGYPNARVDASVGTHKGTNRVAITLRVDTGIPQTVRKIVISGARDDLKSVMRLSEGDVLDQNELRRDIERMRKYFQKRNHFRPIVRLDSEKDGVLSFSVYPGKRLVIVIDGNEAVSEKRILKEMPFFDAEDFNDDIVEEAVQRVLSLYHAQGFPFTQIAPVVTEKEDLITLTLFIFEGKKVRTGKISLAGVSLDGARLKDILSLKEGNLYNPDLVESDQETLRSFYHALGYLAADVDEFRTVYDENAQTMDILITVREGLKTEIGLIDVVGAENVSEEQVRKVIQLKPEDPYNEIDISNARYRVIEFYNTVGFPLVDVSVGRSIDGLKAHIIFTISEGPFLTFGKTIVTGNNRTKHDVIKRELLTQDGAPFDNGILRKERQKLYKLALFTDVNVEMVEGDDRRRDVLISLQEGNAGAVEFGLGYSDYELYRGFLDVSYRNLWGMHRQASLRTELSSLERRLILQYYEPWFMNSITAFRAFFLTEYREELNVDNRETRYKLTRNSVSAGIEKKFSSRFKSELFYEFSVVNTYDVKPDVVLSREDIGTLVISGVRLGFIFDTRNDPFYPTKGILTGISAKLTSPVFLSESDFMKLSCYGNIYHEIKHGLVVAASLRAGFARGYGSTTAELPIVERFFLGGRTTVRGYEQDTLGPKGSDGNPTGGNVFLMENLEMRISLGRGIGVVTFLDGGNVWLKVRDVDPFDTKFTTGIGLRYDTPVGPLRVDYGHKLQREKGESAGEVHFSIGHAF